jgi:hypothetical protein
LDNEKMSSNKAINLLNDFLREQDHAYRLLKEQYPAEKVDLYQDRLGDLLANLRVLMYYQISPNQLDSLLKLNKAHCNFEFLNEVGLDLETYGKIVENLQTLLYKQGQLNTFREHKPVDRHGAPTPWITYPALEFLSQFDYAECSVFEFGAGNSTLFWAGRAKNVVSVETDKEWFDVLQQQKPSNVQLSHIDDAEEFAESILKADSAFDVIVIDSMKHRYGATLSAIKRVATGGFIIFDNSDWYPNSCRLLRDAGFFQIDFHGFGPVNGYTWTTSLFFRDGIKLKRIENEVHPVGGITTCLEDDEPQPGK